MPMPNRCTSAHWQFAKRLSVPITPMSRFAEQPGSSIDYQGRYRDAEPLYKRSLTIREKVLGPDHPDVAVSLNSLAQLYHAEGHYADAEPLYKRSLQYWKRHWASIIPMSRRH